MTRRTATVLGAALLALAALTACDSERIAQLEEGVATEADVKRQFGEPAAVFTEADGGRTFEYPRQPEGRANYFITIGTDGKMSALRQVLRADIFAKVQPGMDQAELRRLLGRPARTQVFALKNEEVWDWRWLENGQKKVFSVSFDTTGRVKASASVDDPGELYTGGK